MEKLHPIRVVESRRVRALHCLKEIRVKEKERGMTVLRPLHHHLSGKGGESRKGNSKNKPAITQGKASESVPKSNPSTGSTPASSSTNPGNTSAKSSL